MEILELLEGDVQVLRLIGNFDVIDVEALNSRVEAAIEAKRARIALDASGMDFICSAALAALIHAQQRLGQHGGELAIASLAPFAAGVCRTLGLDRKLRCFDTVDEACAWLRERGGEGEGHTQAARAVGSAIEDADAGAAAATPARIDRDPGGDRSRERQA